MGLHFPGAWRFQPPADGQFIYTAVPDAAITEFLKLIDRISGQGDRWATLEHFKSHFGASYRSSSEDWAQTDLIHAMEAAGAENAPLFIEAFVNACDALRNRPEGWHVPDAGYINELLVRHNVGYEIRPPDLVARDLTSTAIPVPVAVPSIASQARATIETSLNRSEQLLFEGRSREAVQEVLWLLETVSTAFRGLHTESGKIEGRYFNKIVGELRARRAGTTLERILEWAAAMHGYLSSPTGGGVRHGMDLNTSVSLDLHEARLFCNLTRSYILFLLAEHKSLVQPVVESATQMSPRHRN